jgi:hypothetical protein
MKSEQLLNLIKQHLIPDLHIFPNRFNPIDAYSQKYQMSVEVKCKDEFHYWPYIEKQKYQSMMEHPKSLYVNSMEEGGDISIYGWYFHLLPEPTWHTVMNPNASNELYTKWEPTPMGYIHVSQGINITNRLIF